MTTHESTILILGAGTFGTSTAYHLARSYSNPSKVTVIDRAPNPPKPAASIDLNRIIRPDFDSPLYCNLAWEAAHEWFWGLELQQFFRQVGGVMMWEDKRKAEACREVFRGRGYDNVVDLELEEVGGFKGIGGTPVLGGTSVEGFESAYFNPDAGWVNAAKATACYMHEAMKYGVQRVTAEIEELVVEGGRVVGVRTSDGRVRTAEKIVLATGAWTSMLMSPVEDALGLEERDRVERQVRAAGCVSVYYKVDEEEVKRMDKAPVVMYGDRGQVIPASEENRMIKYTDSRSMFTNTVTTPSGHKISAPAARHQWDVPEGLKKEMHENVTSKLMPEFAKGKEPDHWRICWDSRTPTLDWLMCRHPDERLDNLFLACGGSFASYKFLPNSGRYMRNVLEGKSNGEEKDKAWAWKKNVDESGQPSRELKDFEDVSSSRARL